MNTFRQLPLLGQIAPLALGLLVVGCGGSGGSGGGGGGNFQVESVNLAPNSVWAINRPITIQFSDAVDFSTVSLNSINIRQINGTPAVGEFSLLNSRTISFQPVCPRLPDFSDSGLRAGGVLYELRLLGGSPFAVRSTSGATLSTSEQRTFTTPNSLDPAALFFDTVTGSPAPVIRSPTSVDPTSSYVEIAGDPSNRVYFERATTGVVTLEAGFELPLNLLSDRTSKVAFLIAFNQPVDPSSSNIASNRLRIEYLDQTATWQPLTSLLSLEANCTGTGSVVRIEPLGSLPSSTQLRVFLAPDFRDIVGETNSITQVDFAPAATVVGPAVIADSLEEEFLYGGTAPGSREDTAPPLGLPLANWGGGSLSTAFGFTGTGGPNGNFDWEVKQGQVFVLDTATTILVGGPNFAPTSQQVVVGGLLDLRNFRVAAGGILKIQGQNPVTILASGFVQIDGIIEISGTDSRGVGSLNTTNIPEPGATGIAGGGRGGIGSPLTNASSPRGTPGQGAFGQPDLGGQGGEATFWTGGQGNLDARRGTGGGGGRLGADQFNPTNPALFDQTFIGLDAEKGFNNLAVASPLPIGAVSGQAPPTGGAAGPAPFTDAISTNDFFGAAFDVPTSAVILGELSRPWAGAGGGGGGDACWSSGAPFPVVPFDIGGDEKAAGGGGGGGSLQVLALGNIVFGPNGVLKCRGGTGGGGENTNFLDRVGGGSGGASGGHVVLQTAGKIDFRLVTGLTAVSIIATGGQGGAGKDNAGGAQIGNGGSQETPPANDACPSAGTPPTCAGPISGAGGDGGPGIIQLHTPNGLGGGDILLPTAPVRTLADLCKPRPVAATATLRMLPTFGRYSVARSVWIPIGLSGFDPAASAAPFFKTSIFDFAGINTATGEVDKAGGVVDLANVPVLLGPVNIDVQPALPYIDASGRTIFMDATNLTGPLLEYWLTNPGLLKRSTLRLSQVGLPSNNRHFDVVTAVVDTTQATPRLKLTTSALDPLLTSFSTPAGVAVELFPTSFKIKTNGVTDALPASAAVYLKFQAAPATAAGLPDTALAVPSVPGSDIGLLNSSPRNPDFRFLLFQVEFDIDRLNTGVTPTSPLPALDFLRLPFRH